MLFLIKFYDVNIIFLLTLHDKKINLKNKSDIDINKLTNSLRGGSLDAFNEIYNLFAPKLLSYVAKATRNKDDAAEIVNDIFLNLWVNHSKIQSGTDISTLLFSIAYRKRIDFFRRMMNAPIYQDYLQFQNELQCQDISRIEYNEFCAIFNKALAALPDRLQKFLVLSRVKCLTNNEIAQKMNLSEKTVRNGISLGLKLLKEQLDTLGKDFL